MPCHRYNNEVSIAYGELIFNTLVKMTFEHIEYKHSTKPRLAPGLLRHTQSILFTAISVSISLSRLLIP